MSPLNLLTWCVGGAVTPGGSSVSDPHAYFSRSGSSQSLYGGKLRNIGLVLGVTTISFFLVFSFDQKIVFFRSE